MSYLDHLESWPWLKEVSRVLGSGWATTLAHELHEGTLVDLGSAGVDTGQVRAGCRKPLRIGRAKAGLDPRRELVGPTGQLTLDGRTE